MSDLAQHSRDIGEAAEQIIDLVGLDLPAVSPILENRRLQVVSKNPVGIEP
jgi:hypothetical protein